VIVEDPEEENKEESKGEDDKDSQDSLGEGQADEGDEEEEETYDLVFPAEYHDESSENQIVDQIEGADGKIQRLYESGKK